METVCFTETLAVRVRQNPEEHDSHRRDNCFDLLRNEFAG
jgi:hypothetical protein